MLVFKNLFILIDKYNFKFSNILAEFLMNSVELEDDKNSDWNVTVNEVNKIVTHNQKAPKSTSTEAAQLVSIVY